MNELEFNAMIVNTANQTHHLVVGKARLYRIQIVI